MAGRGRGRGRGQLAQVGYRPPAPGGGNDVEAKVAQAPAEGPPKKESRAATAMKDLEAEIQNLSADGSDPSEDDLQRFDQLATIALTSMEDVQTVASLLYNKVVGNRDYAKPIAMVCEKLSNMEKEGTRFRSTVLGLVQADYKAREELKTKSRDRFLGCVTFLSHLFGMLRLANGEVMQPLVGPIFDCMDLILDSDRLDDVETECVSLQLQMIGRELQEHGEERMQQLMNLVRIKIIREQTKPQVRCYLLELLESYMRRWQMAPNDVTRFYLDTMADIFAGIVLDS